MAKAETEPTNITQLRPPDPTNADRQRRHRAKKRKRRATVTRKPARTVTVPVTPTVTPSRSIATVTLLAALSLATCSAAFSISGLTSIFAGGVYGFLSRAHIEHALAGDLTVTSKAATVDASVEAKQYQQAHRARRDAMHQRGRR